MLSMTKADTSIQRVIGIDWSGRVDAAGQRRHIWAGIWTRQGDGRIAVKLEAGRTRDEVATWLIELARKTPRMVIGLDFCFSYPAWFVRDEHGLASAPAFWRHVADEGHIERWLARGAEDRRFWGKPHKRPAEFSGEHLHRMMRATDIDCKMIAHIPEPERQERMKGITPKSVFQIGGSGSVGTASLRGFPLLLRLRDAGFCIWPFDAPQLDSPLPRPLVLEMYSRLNTGPVHKSNPAARAAYLLQKCREDPAYAALSQVVMQRARGSEDAFDALVSTMVMAERYETFAVLPKPRDPLHGIEGWTWAPEVR
jgi:hypothetical protein